MYRYIENQASGHTPAPSLLTIRQPIAVWHIFQAERGPPDPPRHRSRDTREISGEMRALGPKGPLPRLNSKYTWNTHLFSVHSRQAHIRPRRSFFAYSVLNINFKGVHMKLKSVGLEILFCTNFYDVSRLSYRPSNFARANKPYAAG